MESAVEAAEPLPAQQPLQQCLPQQLPLQGGLRDATNSFAYGFSGSGCAPAAPNCSAHSLSHLAPLQRLLLQRSQQQPVYPPALPVQLPLQQQGGGPVLALAGSFPLAGASPLSILQYSQLQQQLSGMGASAAAPPARQQAPQPGPWPVLSATQLAPPQTHLNQLHQQQWQLQPQLVLQHAPAPAPAPVSERRSTGSSPAHLQAILAALQSLRLQTTA